jgi:hypothetical protein
LRARAGISNVLPRGVFNRANGTFCIFAVFDVGNHDADRADVESADDEALIVVVWPHDRRDTRTFGSPDEIANVHSVWRSMFGVDHNEVDSMEAGHFDDVTAVRSAEHSQQEFP